MLVSSPRLFPVVLAAVAGLLACSRSQNPPKQPLVATSASTGRSAVRDALPEAARNALDKGNAEFRTGAFESALKEYRTAAAAAPSDAAPYFGIYMVAQKLHNKALADSASKEIAGRNGVTPMLSDSAMRALHNPDAPTQTPKPKSAVGTK